MKRLNIRQLFQINDGFTLIELILVLGICSIIILPIYSILDISLNSFNSGEEKDELLLNARHSIEYIKNEIRSADIIVPQYKIESLNSKYPTNIGFLLVFIDERENKKDIYKYVTYHTKDGKLIRVTCNCLKGTYPTYDKFEGYNEICRMVETINNTEFDIENSMVYLDFDFKEYPNSKHSLNINSNIYIRCEIDY